MDKKKIYPFRIRPDSYEEMRKILRFPEVTGPENDGQICRVTVNNYSPDLSLKNEFVNQYKSVLVFKVRLLENSDREFIVLASMPESLSEPVIVE